MTLRKSFIALLSLAALGATPPPPNTDDPLQQAYRAENTNAHARALQLFQQAAFGPDCAVRDQNALASARMLMGAIDPQAVWAGKMKPHFSFGPQDLARVQRAEARDALDEIAAQAAKAQIVILNEHHDAQRSRAFALQVARRLRPLGYDILAAETFTNMQDAKVAAQFLETMKADGYPRLINGTYTHDPVFAGFVREALALGYQPAAYETTNYDMSGDTRAQIERREQEEAENLGKLIAAHPGRKIFIYVGFSHAAEQPIPGLGGKISWMATRLKAQTGIDPLTIEQTVFMPASMQPSDDPLLEAVEAKAGQAGHSIALFDGADPLVFGQYAGAMDLQIVHPRIPDRAGRPGWLFEIGRSPQVVPDSFRPGKDDVLVKAFGVNDANDAVALDMVIWRAGQTAPSFLLPPGPVRYSMETMPPATCPMTL